MRILELNFEKYWRGGERQTIYSILGFINAGHSVELICRKGSPLEEKAVFAGIKVVPCKGIFQVLSFLLSSAKDFDILHCQTSNMLTYCIATKWIHKKPVILSRRVSYKPHGYFTFLKYRLTNKIIVVSEAVKQILLSVGITHVKVISDIAVPLVLNRTRASDFIRLNSTGDKKILITMAALEAEKDPLTLFNVIRRLHNLRNDFVFFHFGGGSMFETIKGLVAEHNMQTVYHLAGFLENVQDFFSIADVFVFSSVEEGLGSSILDAFLYKVPVASTDGGGLKNLLAGNRGLLSSIKDEDGLLSNILILMDNQILRDKLTSKGYDYVISEHSMEKITVEYLYEFEQCV